MIRLRKLAIVTAPSLVAVLIALAGPTAAQMVDEFTLPLVPSGPFQITSGPDGNLWFTESQSDQIGRISTAGALTEFPLPANTNPTGITVGADGNIWFTEFDSNQIGRITTNGMITHFPIPTAASSPFGIVAAPD